MRSHLIPLVHLPHNAISWCGPCQMIAPVFKQLAEDHDDVIFLKVDVDENQDTAAQYQVSAMPTFVSCSSYCPITSTQQYNQITVSHYRFSPTSFVVITTKT